MTTVPITLTKAQAEVFLAIALERLVSGCASPSHRTLATRLERAAFQLEHARAHVARDSGGWNMGSGAEKLAREYLHLERDLKPFLRNAA